MPLVLRGHKRGSDPLELKLYLFVSYHLGANTRTQVLDILKHLTISLVPEEAFLKRCHRKMKMRTRPSSLEDNVSGSKLCSRKGTHCCSVYRRKCVCVWGEPLRGKVSRKHFCVLFYRQVVVFTFLHLIYIL